MRKLTSIAAICGAIVFGRCSKDDLQPLREGAHSEATIKKDTIFFDNGQDSNNNSTSDTAVNVTCNAEETWLVDLMKGDTALINIKEVSDGDDEADNGDDSKTNN